VNKLKFNNSFTQLGDPFFTRVEPTGLPNPGLVSINKKALALLGLDPQPFTTDISAPSEDISDATPAYAFSPEWFLQWASGNKTLAGSAPLAMVYSGHQFGSYVPQLGDGRGLLLGEVEGPEGKWDIHLKGAGKTPYSRFGDGRAVLRSSIREYLCSEAMHGLGIASTRALSIVTSDEPVYRETVESATMLIRLARSHVRFGSFEYFHHTQQFDAVKKLADHVIEQHLPELSGHEASHQEEPYLEMFRFTVHQTAKLIAQWQAVGFAHGVMNTDNMSMIGDTLDYGPFGFLDAYNPRFICNHSDQSGRYAFNQQPVIGLWNCNALANALTSLLPVEQLTDVLKEYEPLFISSLLSLHRQKLGLAITDTNDQSLINELLNLLAENQVDHTIFFRNLSYFDDKSLYRGGGINNHLPYTNLRDLFIDRDAFDPWAEKYRQRLSLETRSTKERRQSMLKTNPKYILRNYMAETAIRKAEDDHDYREIDRLLKLLQSPYDEHPDSEEYAKHPPLWSKTLSVSCSS
jgi:uncharacterized protein YdiU (UPF0061 family)